MDITVEIDDSLLQQPIKDAVSRVLNQIVERRIRVNLISLEAKVEKIVDEYLREYISSDTMLEIANKIVSDRVKSKLTYLDDEE